MTNNLNNAVWVGCLASYNEGYLHGEWVDLKTIDTVKKLQEQIDRILESSPVPEAEEWAFMDHDLAGIHIDEYEDLERLIDISQGLKEHGLPFVAFHELQGSSDTAEFEESYQGEYNTIEDYAEELLGITGEYDQTPERVQPYINYSKFARDLEYSGDITAMYRDNVVYIFSNL